MKTMMKRYSLVLGSLSLLAAGCAETKNTNPVARIDLQGTPRINQPLVFDASASADAEGPIKRYSFDFGDGSEMLSGVVSRAEHVFTEAGVYNVTVTVTDEGGLRGTNRVEVTIGGNQAPSASLSGPVLAVVGQRITFDGSASSDEDGRITTYAIDFGDGTSGAKPIESHSYAAAGVYDVVLTVTDNEEATASVTRSIQVQTGAQAAAAAPLARLSVAATANARENLTFDASLSQTPGATAQYRTYFGDGNTADGRSVNHAYSIAGSYTAVLMVTASYPDGSTTVSMDAKQITVKALNTVHTAPKAEFTIPASVRFGSTVVFDAAASSVPGATSVAYAWDFGDAAGDTASLSTHTYNTPGLFITRLTITATYEDGTTAQTAKSKVLTVYGNAAPIASISGPAEGLVSDQLIFSADASLDGDGTITGYDWDMGDSSTYSVPGLAKSYAAPGNYAVQLTVTDNDGDTHTATKWVTIRSYKSVVELPEATLNGPVKLTTGQVGSFTVAGSTAPQGTAAYKIYFGDGSTSNKQADTHSYAAPGNYLAGLLVTVTYPDATTNVAVTYLPVEVVAGTSANPAPVADFTAPSQVRFSQTVAMDAGLTAAPGATSITYDWDFGDTNTATGQTATHVFAPGVYTIELLVTATYSDGSVATARRQRVIDVNGNVAPAAAFTAPLVVTVGDVVGFDGSATTDSDGSIASYSYDFGNGQSSAIGVATTTYASAGTYLVTLTVTDNEGATAVASREVRVRSEAETSDGPVAVLSAPFTSFRNELIELDGSMSQSGSNPITTYFWDLGDGRAYTAGASINVTFPTRGNYTVQLAVTDSTGLSSSIQRQISVVNRAPQLDWVSIGHPFVGTFYSNSTVHLVAVGGALDEDGDPISYSYQWYVNGLPEFGQSATTYTGLKAAGDVLTLLVTPSDGFDSGEPVYSNIINIEAPPSPQGLDISGDSPYRVADTITLAVSNPEWNSVFEYQWYVNATLAGTGTSLSGAFAKGDSVFVRARSVEGAYTGPWVNSANETIVNTAPVITSVPLSAGPHTEGTTISVSAVATDADGDTVTFSYEWYVNGGLAASGDSINGTLFDKGDDVYALAVADDGTDTDSDVSATVTIQNSAPGTAGVAIAEAIASGNLFGKILTAATDIDGDAVTYTYAWLRNGVDEGFPSTQTDASNSLFNNGERWTIVVTATDGFASGATSWATAAVSQFKLSAGIGEERYRTAAALLQNGTVLIAGGQTGVTIATSTAELYDPSSGSYTLTGSLITERRYHTATTLPNGKVLIVGGNDRFGLAVTTAELYDPTSGTFAETTDNPVVARYYHTATLLASGKVLLVGSSATAEVYDPVTDTFTATAGAPTASRIWHTATRLADGRVLIAGGSGLATAEIYDPGTDSFTSTGSLSSDRYFHTATLLPDGNVLIVGGDDGVDELVSAELYNPTSGTFAPAWSMATARYLHTATLLENGTVLVTGGFGTLSWVTAAEIYVPATGAWITTRPLNVAHAEHSATLLPDGQVLLNSIDAQELYIPFQ